MKSSIDYIDVIMNSGDLEQIFGVVVIGLSNMTNGKASMDAIQKKLENAKISGTVRLWVDCLIIPVAINHLHLRAEREKDWLLHINTLKMIYCLCCRSLN